jgi:hypothetical protein
LGGSFLLFAWIDTVAGIDYVMPSNAWNVKLSLPLKFGKGV